MRRRAHINWHLAWHGMALHGTTWEWYMLWLVDCADNILYLRSLERLSPDLGGSECECRGGADREDGRRMEE